VSEPTSAARSEVAVLIGRRDATELLIPEPPNGGSGWRLPSVEVAGDATLSVMLEAIKDRIGPLPPVLRVSFAREGGGDAPQLQVVELASIDGLPTRHHWADPRSLDLEALQPSELRAHVRRWLDRRVGGPGPLDPPWTRVGWFERASGWMTERMTAAGRPAVGPPRAASTWELSMILRAPTEGGAMYLKCSVDLFRPEAAVTARLAARTPGLVTPVVDVEPAEGWLLMDDLGDRILGEEPADAWTPGIQALAAVQRAWTGRTDELIAAGARVRSLADLAALVPEFVDRPTMGPHLTEPQRAAIEVATPELVAACRRLAALGPTDTITHGDFHSHNVALGPDGPIIYDWTDAAVSHPFVDLPVFLLRAEDVAARRRMRDAYLAAWSDTLPPEVLAEAGELALVVGALYQVQGYELILACLDPTDQTDMGPAPAAWLRRSVRFLRDGIEASRRDPD
jgi:hypothetical protein